MPLETHYMLLYFARNRLNFDIIEKLYWRGYASLFLVGFVVLLQFVGAVESLLFAWLLVDLLGFGVVVLLGFGFVVNAISAKLQAKFDPQI